MSTKAYMLTRGRRDWAMHLQKVAVPPGQSYNFPNSCTPRISKRGIGPKHFALNNELSVHSGTKDVVSCHGFDNYFTHTFQ